jgi:hypothetical protein
LVLLRLRLYIVGDSGREALSLFVGVVVDGGYSLCINRGISC